MTALSIAAVWMYNLVLATVHLTNPKEPPPSTWLRSFFSVLIASALAALALLPSIISAVEGRSEGGGRPGLCACVVTRMCCVLITPSTTVLTPLKHAAIGLHALVHSTMHTYLEFYIRA